jgi:hypothetical protein
VWIAAAASSAVASLRRMRASHGRGAVGYDVRVGEGGWVFCGTAANAASEFNVKKSTVSRCARNLVRTIGGKGGYRFQFRYNQMY